MDDTIDRQRAIATAVCAAIDWHRLANPQYSIAYSIGEAIRALPSSQPPKEIPKRVLWTGWKGYRDTRYKCPNCEKPVRNDDHYCHRCGQRLMFPKISFTEYVPGEKQDVIVRWDDEG